MKRSKIFLAATTGLLAIAGIAAAKTHLSPIVAAYTTGDNQLCTKLVTLNGQIIDNTQAQVGYTFNNVAPCHTPVYFNQE